MGAQALKYAADAGRRVHRQHPVSQGMMDAALPVLIANAARLTGQTLSAAQMADVREAWDGSAVISVPALVAAAWSAGRLKGEVRTAFEPRPRDCPFIYHHAHEGWLIAVSRNADGTWTTVDAVGVPRRVEAVHGLCALLPTGRGSRDGPAASSLTLLATLLTNLLALASAAVISGFLAWASLGS